jgi:hypothetical protein
MLQKIRLALLRSTTPFLILAVALVAMLFGHASANAAIIVNDTWQDGVRTDPASPTYAENNGAVGTDADSDGDLESAWLVNNNGGSNSTTVGHMTTGVPTGSMNWFTYFTPDATPVTLANTGDQLRVTWQFTPTGVNTGNTSQQFNIGLARTPSGARGVDGSAPPSAAYTGYALYTNMGNTLGNSNPFQLRERTAASSSFLNSSSDWNTILGNGAASGNHGYDSGTPYTLVWTITRNGLGLDVAATMSGGTLNTSGTASVSVNDANGNGFTFDTFGVRPSGSAGTATSFDTTLFKVEFNQVPEPTSLALTLCSAAFLWLRRRGR